MARAQELPHPQSLTTSDMHSDSQTLKKMRNCLMAYRTSSNMNAAAFPRHHEMFPAAHSRKTEVIPTWNLDGLLKPLIINRVSKKSLTKMARKYCRQQIESQNSGSRSTRFSTKTSNDCVPGLSAILDDANNNSHSNYRPS